MKILQVPSTFLPRMGGVPYYVYYLSKEMIKRGNNVSVLTSNVGSNIKKECIEGIPVERVSSFLFLGMPVSFSLFFKIVKSDADLINLHYPHPLFLDVAVLACLLGRKKYVIYSHGKEVRMPWLFGCPSWIYNTFFYNFALKHAKGILINSKKAITTSKVLKKHSKKTHVVYHGVDTKKFRKRRAKQSKKIRILFVGALRKYKGLTYFIDAISLLKQENVCAVIVGNGNQEEHLKQYVRDKDLSNLITFKEFMPEEDLLKEYASCDVFVLPSPSLEESFGLVALEAGAMGKPVIVTKGAGVSEVFLKEKIGIVVKPYSGKALAKAISSLSNPSYRQAVGLGLEKTISSRYSWKNVADATIKKYELFLK